MIIAKQDYNSKLDKLRYYFENYAINQDGVVIDKSGNEITDEEIIINTKFIILYCLAYKNNLEAIQGRSIENLDDEYFQKLLTDYGNFDIFMNICVKEYHVYDDVGTGKSIYYPYGVMVNYIVQNDISKKILIDYIDYEIDNVNNLENGKQLIKNLD